MLAADLYYNILDGAGQGLAAAGCAPLNGADSASAQAVVGVTQSPPPMLHNNNPAAWADFGSQPLFLPGHGVHGAGDEEIAQRALVLVDETGSRARISVPGRAGFGPVLGEAGKEDIGAALLVVGAGDAQELLAAADEARAQIPPQR